MENYNDDSFEGFLKNEVENQNIYPSEHVWENIRVKLHGNPAWPALTFGVMFVLATVIAFTMLNYPPTSILLKKIEIEKENVQPVEANTNNNVAVPSNKNNVYDNFYRQLNPVTYFNETLAGKGFADSNTNLQEIAVNKNFENISTVSAAGNNHAITTANLAKQTINTISIVAGKNEEQQIKNAVNATENKSKYANKLNSPLNTSMESNPSADDYLKDFQHTSIPHSKIKSRFEVQFYLTPSISYRNLSEDKSRAYYQTTFSSASQTLNTNINKVVRQIPALGFEVGGAALYRLTPWLKIKTGLQFNVRQYYIDAYQSFGIATIAVVKDYRLDSMQYFSTLSNINNNGNSTKVNNKLYQISIPVGLQIDLFNKKKIGLSISASTQPTFTLNKNVYVISTDYKYYANGSPFFRKWNLNSAAEINITYKTKGLKWSIGPQIRYQHYPTYNDVYPIKEHRLDYGIKLGVSTSLFGK